MIKKTNVKIDRDMLEEAIEKSRRMNIALTGTKLVNFMLLQVTDNGLEIDFNPQTFCWVEKFMTTMYWEKEQLEKLSTTLKKCGLRSDYSFIFNFLVWGFLNKY